MEWKFELFPYFILVQIYQNINTTIVAGKFVLTWKSISFCHIHLQTKIDVCIKFCLEILSLYVYLGRTMPK